VFYVRGKEIVVLEEEQNCKVQHKAGNKTQLLLPPFSKVTDAESSKKGDDGTCEQQ
jgi:hypothetical protein